MNEINISNTKENIFKKGLVIGGAGMLGFEIASQLLDECKEVRILDLQPVDDDRFIGIVGDIRNQDDIDKACQGVDVVFQTAAAIWNPVTPDNIYDEVNINGNKNVINSCYKYGIKKLVFTSSMDVVVDGKKPIVYGDETLPYPVKMPRDNYSRTKIISEKFILDTNSEKLSTCALRPAGIYGPRDKYHIPNIIKAAQSKPAIKVGNGSAKFSHVYSENAAHAHILAAKNLFPGSKVAGNIYFITDYQPAENLFDFMAPFLIEFGLEPIKKSIPYPIAYALSCINEKINPCSNFNSFSIIQTCVDHTFVHHKATRDFGYQPIVSKEEAFKRTVTWFKKNHKF